MTCKQHNSTCPGVQVFLISVIRSEGRAKGGKCLGRHFPEGGISRKIKIIRPVYGHLNALNARYPSIRGVLWRLKWTLKCTKFIFGRGSTPYAHWGASHTSQLGPRTRRGGRMKVCPGHYRSSRRHCQLLHVNHVTVATDSSNQ